MSFNSKSIQAFVGTGITLPLQLVNGRVPLESGFELIRKSIITILTWPYGTRFFLNQFGSRVEELLEEPNDDILQNIAQTFIVDAINMWEPRINLLDSTFARSKDSSGMDLQIRYEIIATQQIDSFIFPFYRQISN